MSHIEEMIRELCPNGVEYKKLKNTTTITRGVRVVKSQLQSIGSYPVYQNSLTPMGYYDKYNCSANTTFIIGAGSAGEIGYSSVDFWAADDCFFFVCPDNLQSRFLYFVLLSQQNIIRSQVRKASIPRLGRAGGGYSEGVKWCKLSDIGTFYGGLTGKSKRDFIAGNAKFITYMNVYSNIAIDVNMNDMVQIAEGEKQNKVEYGDVVFTGSSETPDDCGMSSVMTTRPDGDLYLNSFCFGFRMNDRALLLPDFMKFLFRSEEIRKQIIKTASGVTRFNVSKKRFGEVVIPIPPMKEQQRIVAILDKFETLVNDISEGLPVEIAARRQQYEYYRDKLLTFKRKEDAKIQPGC